MTRDLAEELQCGKGSLPHQQQPDSNAILQLEALCLCEMPLMKRCLQWVKRMETLGDRTRSWETETDTLTSIEKLCQGFLCWEVRQKGGLSPPLLTMDVCTDTESALYGLAEAAPVL